MIGFLFEGTSGLPLWSLGIAELATAEEAFLSQSLVILQETKNLVVLDGKHRGEGFVFTTRLFELLEGFFQKVGIQFPVPFGLVTRPNLFIVLSLASTAETGLILFDGFKLIVQRLI